MKRTKPIKGQRRQLPDGSNVVLIEPKETNYSTYIKSDFEYDQEDLRETNPYVYCKQKWIVDLIEYDIGGRERMFKCIREIHWILGPYLRRHTDEFGNEVIKIRELK